MSLFASLELGKKSLAAAQGGQNTTGHNIANVNTEGFSRQQLEQAAGKPLHNGQGSGVEITGIRRIHDIFTKQKIVDEQAKVGTYDTRTETLTRAEIIYTDLDGHGVRGALDEFWGAWRGVANEPEKEVLRTALVDKSRALTSSFRVLDNRISELRNDLNARAEADMLEVNALAKKLADLNRQVQQVTNRSGNANDLRDQRELVLQKLAEKISISWFENKRGHIEVSVGNGQILVHERSANVMVPFRKTDENGMHNIGIRVKSGQVYDITEHVKDGTIKEYVNQRDGNLKNYQENLNLLVRELAFQVNKLHSQGTGVGSGRFRETGAYGLNADARKNPLPFIKTGEFEIKLVNDDGDIHEVVSIPLEAGTESVESIVEKINSFAGAYETDKQGNKTLSANAKLKATVNDDGSVTIQAGLGNRFIFGKDDTNVLPILGFNNFFHVVGGAEDIRLNERITEDEMNIVAGSDLVPGDNRVAVEIASLQFKNIMSDGTVTLDEFYNSQAADIGLRLQRAQKGQKNSEAILDQFITLRDSVSSVNLDEEMANMVKYQRAYEATAKFVTTVDEMTQTLINM